MTSFTVNQAMNNLNELIFGAIKNSDEILIVSDIGSVVVVDQKEWDSLQETLLLLRDKKALRSLLEGHKSRDENKPIDSKSIDEAFYDLQN
jgi:PHD/YefM family antitoxin component YafN of YafNO toxin-antitoxin module